MKPTLVCWSSDSTSDVHDAFQKSHSRYSDRNVVELCVHQSLACFLYCPHTQKKLIKNKQTKNQGFQKRKCTTLFLSKVCATIFYFKCSSLWIIIFKYCSNAVWTKNSLLANITVPECYCLAGAVAVCVKFLGMNWVVNVANCNLV